MYRFIKRGLPLGTTLFKTKGITVMPVKKKENEEFSRTNISLFNNRRRGRTKFFLSIEKSAEKFSLTSDQTIEETRCNEKDER